MRPPDWIKNQLRRCIKGFDQGRRVNKKHKRHRKIILVIENFNYRRFYYNIINYFIDFK